jgi:nucleotide-binding universal stress UspA family protein
MVTLSEITAQGAVAPTTRTRYVPGSRGKRGPVVLATDGTSRSGSAVVAAQLIADHLDVPLEVVSVLEATPAYVAVPEFVIPSDPAIDEGRRDDCETMVTDYVSRFGGGAAPPQVHVRFGGIAAELSRFAREDSATLIVMGSAPHRRFRHVVSGDRAAQVLHSARCPVLSVPPTFSELPRVAVVAVDFSPASVAAARAALLVVRDGGVVVLTHVLTPLMRAPVLSDPNADETAADVHELFDRLREELGPSTRRGVKLETRLITDDPINGILSSADHLDADLIAVGTHGQGAIARFLLGSVAESVLHRSERTVLACPPPPPAEALELSRRITGVARSSREQEWAATLDTFTRRNAGRSVMLEVDDPDTGARVTSHGYALMGVTYEPQARRVEIMLGDKGRPFHHLTRSVVHPDGITMTETPGGGGETLDIQHGRGHTVAVVSDVTSADVDA